MALPDLESALGMNISRGVLKKIFSHLCWLRSNRVCQSVNLNVLPNALIRRSSSKKKGHCRSKAPHEHGYRSLTTLDCSPILTMHGCALSRKANGVDPLELAPVMY